MEIADIRFLSTLLEGKLNCTNEDYYKFVIAFLGREGEGLTCKDPCDNLKDILQGLIR